MKKVIIDASRGGEDAGITRGGIVEKDFNLDISNYINNYLKNRGINSTVIRTNDTTLTDSDRISRINNIGIDKDTIIISNRMNNDTSNEIIYALRNSDSLASDIADSLADNGYVVDKYYQLRLPSDTSKDYYYITRNTSPAETIIIEYGDIANIPLLGDSVGSAIYSYINRSNIYIVKSGDSLYSIARKYNTTVDEIKRLNNLSSNVLSIGQVLKIPSSSESNNTGSNTGTTNTYVVKSGDSLYSIARKYNTTVDELKRLNNLSSNVLSIGQVLKIPSSESNNTGSGTGTTNAYVVKSGDSLYSIARKYNTTVDEIKSLNNLTSNLLSIGQVLKIPSGSSTNTYVVKSGDNLYSIARKYQITVNELKKLNNLNSNLLSIGQVLKVPKQKY